MAGCPLLASILHAETARIARCPFAKNKGENDETEEPTRGEAWLLIARTGLVAASDGKSDDVTRMRSPIPVLRGAFQHELDARDFCH